MVKNKEINRLIEIVEGNIIDLEYRMAEVNEELEELQEDLKNNKDALEELKKL